jgi:hypothetical protein
VGNGNGVGLEGLEGKLLGQHDVGDGEPAGGKEAQAMEPPAEFVEDIDVHRIALADPVAAAACPANDVEVAETLVLVSLRCCQVCQQ